MSDLHDFKNLYDERKINTFHAGAGWKGIMIFVPAAFAAFLLYRAESYGFMMLLLAFGLWGYLAGSQIINMIWDILKTLVITQHITAPTSDIITTNQIFRDNEQTLFTKEDFEIDFDKAKDSKLVPLLSKSLKEDQFHDAETLNNILQHSVYSIAHEHYSYNISILEFIGNAMPLFGLAGTVAGLIETLKGINDNISISDLTGSVSIAMETTLWGALLAIIFKVIASRFKIQREALDYDFEELENHIENFFKQDLKNNKA